MKLKSGIFIILLAGLVASAQTNKLTSLLQQGLFEEQANRNLDAAIADYQTLATQFDQDRQMAATAVFRLGECYRAQGKTNEAAAQYQRILRDFSDQAMLATLSRQNLVGMGAAKTEAAAVDNPTVQLWNKIKDLPEAELEKLLPTLVNDGTLTDLLQKRNDAQQKRASLVVDYATNNPAVERVDVIVVELNRQIAEKVSGIMQGLKLQAETLPTPQLAGDARQQQKELLAKQIALAEQDLSDTQMQYQVGKATQAGIRNAEREVLRLRQQLAALDSGRRAELLDLSVPVKSEEDQEIERVEKLLQTSPDLINKYSNGGTLLSKAAVAGQMKVVNYLLDHGAEVNDYSALSGAAAVGNRAMVELLLQRGANVNQGVLTKVAQEGFVSILELLLAHKADPNATDNYDQTPLFDAVYYGHDKCARLLLAHGADPNIVRKAKPGEMNQGRNDGRRMFGTPLHTAAAGGSTAMVALLLTNRADVKALNTYSETPLQVAAACGRADVAELLLSAGADPNARVDASDSTPLHLATSGGYRDVVERLLAHGAKPNETAKLGNADVNVTALMLAATGGNDDIALLLLQNQADPNLKDSVGYTALIRAILAGKTAVAKTLLAHGANPEVKDGEWPALMMAAARNPEITSALLAAGANVNVVAGGQQTALLEAAANGNFEIVQILLAAHANVNVRGADGNTPLHLAVMNGRGTIVPLLLDAKADPNIRNNSGGTPLDLAKENKSLADLLRQNGAVDELPDFTRIRITRQGLAQPLEVFRRAATQTNQFTLLETVMRFYSQQRVFLRPGFLGDAAWNFLPFPDFGRIIIRRPNPKIGGKEQEIKVSLLNSSNVVDCAQDVAVQFGDVIEIPESVHTLNAGKPNPVAEMESAFVVRTYEMRLPPQSTEELARAAVYRSSTLCLQKSVQLVVAGEPTTFKVNSWKEGFLSQALGKTEARSVLRSSSDLSRVKVTRKIGKSAKPAVFTVNVSDSSQHNDDLWLQDGDVIEVPEKP